RQAYSYGLALAWHAFGARLRESTHQVLRVLRGRQSAAPSRPRPRSFRRASGQLDLVAGGPHRYSGRVAVGSRSARASRPSRRLAAAASPPTGPEPRERAGPSPDCPFRTEAEAGSQPGTSPVRKASNTHRFVPSLRPAALRPPSPTSPGSDVPGRRSLSG